ncbi:hypothetical protein BEL04_04750 [Mucilaginibacter sp. PPCGB 2223]|uniref:hypothetical protein n=1 Tax=Mucilaginibacter sp. PPCGB 2223 TaxID=1886027 RepID=UPI0008255AF2|nr:hypothetical protein [Mucilaginibacter sp. PPCGB 2223]OCX53606.1 hypothetical protein BEL04_04750 [Mucilaginibacter sp. PPCGB 2223]
MKNSIKLGAVALVVAVAFAACGGNKSASTVDSTVVKKDSTVKVDSVKADTTKKDTTKKM